jgi:small-conductance mechanosensitive channel
LFDWYAPAVFFLWLVLLWLAKRYVFFRLKRWAASTRTSWDDVLIEAVSFPVDFLIFASGLVLLLKLLPLPEKADLISAKLFQGSVIFSIVLFMDRLTRALLDNHVSQPIFSKVSHGFTKGVVRVFIIGIGVLIFLDLLGVSITPILASLGIGSFAVALALQDTLSNFFAGIYVAVDKPVQAGDFIRLENGEEGYVVEVGWRSTRIRTLPNNVVIIPNAKLMGSILTNYYLPDKEIEVSLDVGVDYRSDLTRVEQVVCDVAREVLKKVPGAVSSFEPAVRFHAFADSSVNFKVVMRAKEFSDSYLIKHEFIKALHARFKKEGIVIPYPVRTVETREKPV